MSKKIFVALSTFAEYNASPLKLLEKSGYDFSVNTLGRRLVREEIIALGKDADGIVAGVEPYDDFVLERLPRLKCISRCGVGIDNIDLKKAAERRIVIRNTPDVVIQPVVELTVAMIFDLLRRLSYHTGILKSRQWKKRTGNLLLGKKIGILGLGRIGKRVAETMIKLGNEVYGTDINPDKNWASENGVHIVSFEELLAVSDVLSIHANYIKEKPLLIGDREMSLMKEGAFLLNVSRGQLVDEEALYSALKNGHLAGAALDVFSQEPYAGKLCELDNIVLTPHVATLTVESRTQMEVESVENLLNHLNS